jgi:hypothetical protein
MLRGIRRVVSWRTVVAGRLVTRVREEGRDDRNGDDQNMLSERHTGWRCKDSTSARAGNSLKLSRPNPDTRVALAVRLTILAFSGERERERSDRRVRPTATPCWTATAAAPQARTQLARQEGGSQKRCR